MKLHLLHGSAINISRSKLLQLKGQFSQDNVMVFEKGQDLETILTNLTSQSLFDGERLIIAENPPEDFTDYSLLPIPYTLIFWFDHQVSEKKPILDWVRKSKGQILFFPEQREVSVFPFLDYLAKRDKKAFLEIEKLKKGGFDIHYLITMVFYLLRNLTAAPKNAPLFVKQKLERQRKNFSNEKITDLYKDILEIDFKIKSGLLENSQAEFLLVNLFCD